jgi:endonuclease III related protein
MRYRWKMAVSPKRVYRRLLRARGPKGWWPGRTTFEVCAGAILVQNTAWPNAERALRALESRGRLSYEGLRDLTPEEIAPIIRSSGTFNVKARRLAAFVEFLGRRHGGSVEAMSREEPSELRRQLLSVPGIGPETADCIALYAARHPFFVVDGYTRRVFSRLGLIRGDESYDEVQRFFTRRLPGDTALFNDYHAQIVGLAQDACRARPRCTVCPLDDLCPKRGVA